MYQRPRSGGYSSFAHRPYNRGRTGGARPGGASKLLGCNVNLFIKKAVEETSTTSQTITHQFTDFGLPSILLQNIARKGYTVPSPIQDQAISHILAGRDLIGVANTGTGKTAAFLIPIIDKLLKNPADRALIVAPTRELAGQIREELRSLTGGMRIGSTLIIGGASLYRQISDLRQNNQVVIATPGRLKDLIQRKQINLNSYSTFVLDEVDMMVDIGFINDIKYFTALLPAVRQSLFFSATFSPKVNEVLRAFVNNPVTVSVKKAETLGNIEQNIVKVLDRSKKADQLFGLLGSSGFDKVLIFGRTKHGVDNLHKQLLQRGFRAGAIHGNKTQGSRTHILESFKRDEIKILLATDVAARGLDINNVSHVINYDLPATYEDYIHRIGRTGRAGRLGTALTFVD